MSRGEDNGCMMLIGGSLGASLRGLVDVEPILRRVSFVLVGRQTRVCASAFFTCQVGGGGMLLQSVGMHGFQPKTIAL